jgi:hypothetical protein
VVCCAKMGGALRTCHDTAKHTIARSAVEAGFRVEVEVYGVFTGESHHEVNALRLLRQSR